MPFGKKYRKAVEGLDLSQRFSVEEAVEKSLGASFAKFDETVDVAIGLGVDPKYSEFSPGSMLMWTNISDARDLCTTQGKEMVFSIGLYYQDWEYKLRWADIAKTGKVISF